MVDKKHLGVVVLVAFLASCSSGQEAGTRQDSTAASVKDPNTTGTVTSSQSPEPKRYPFPVKRPHTAELQEFPLSTVFAIDRGMDTVFNATWMFECHAQLKRVGLNEPFDPTVALVPSSMHYWSPIGFESAAAIEAYANPITDWQERSYEQVVQQTKWSKSLEGERKDAYVQVMTKGDNGQGCMNDGQKKLFDSVGGKDEFQKLVVELNDLRLGRDATMREDEEFKRVMTRWQECMKAKGFDAKEPQIYGQLHKYKEHKDLMAADIACKNTDNILVDMRKVLSRVEKEALGPSPDLIKTWLDMRNTMVATGIQAINDHGYDVSEHAPPAPAVGT